MKSSSGASGVASRKTPDITGSATKARAAASPAAGLAKAAEVRITAHPATNSASTERSRTPDGVSPSSSVPDRMNQAMAGGWSK